MQDNNDTNTVQVIIKLMKFPVPVRLCCGTGKIMFVIVLSCFAIFKNVDHSYELLGVSPGSKLCATFFNVAKHFKRFVAVAIIFLIFLNSVLCLMYEHFCIVFVLQ